MEDAPPLRKVSEPSQNLAKVLSGEEEPPRTNEKPAVSSGFCKADEGTRTLDLLHGKQTL